MHWSLFVVEHDNHFSGFSIPFCVGFGKVNRFQSSCLLWMSWSSQALRSCVSVAVYSVHLEKAVSSNFQLEESLTGLFLLPRRLCENVLCEGISDPSISCSLASFPTEYHSSLPLSGNITNWVGKQKKLKWRQAQPPKIQTDGPEKPLSGIRGLSYRQRLKGEPGRPAKRWEIDLNGFVNDEETEATQS